MTVYLTPIEVMLMQRVLIERFGGAVLDAMKKGAQPGAPVP